MSKIIRVKKNVYVNNSSESAEDQKSGTGGVFDSFNGNVSSIDRPLQPHVRIICSRSGTVLASELPPELFRYEFVLSGYRDPSLHLTWAQCIWSLLTFHNESVNIHLHLWTGIGCFLVLFSRIYLGIGFDCITTEGVACTVVSCLGCAAMLLCSVYAHTGLAMLRSEDAWRVDVFGVVASNAGRVFVDLWVLFGIICRSRPGFWSVVTLTFLFAFYTVVKAREMKPHWDRWLGLFGLWCQIPFMFSILGIVFSRFGTTDSARSIALWLFISSLCGTGGTLVFYLGKIPERYFNPNGLFDFFGHSHNFFHVCTALSCYAGFMATPHIAAFERVSEIKRF
jgi:predicted membrane channel-forming protein YqfA (hemolysin III family)